MPIKIVKEKFDLSLDKFAVVLKNPPHNVHVSLYTEREVEVKPVSTKKRKYTLDQIGDALFAFIKTTNTRLDNIENRIDKLENKVDGINTRLDYIVKANNLKDLPNNK